MSIPMIITCDPCDDISDNISAWVALLKQQLRELKK